MSSVKFSHYNHVLESICALVLFSDPFSTYHWIQHESWGEKRMVKFAYFFSSLCPLESDPRRAAFVYHRSQLLLKVLHKQPAVSTYHYQPLHSLTIPTTPSVMGMVAVPSLSTRLLLYSFYLPCSLTTSL